MNEFIRVYKNIKPDSKLGISKEFCFYVQGFLKNGFPIFQRNCCEDCKMKDPAVAEPVFKLIKEIEEKLELSKGEKEILKKLEKYPERVKQYREKEKHNSGIREVS